MLIKQKSDISGSEITDPEIYFNRRIFLQRTALALGSHWLLQRQAIAGDCKTPQLPTITDKTNSWSQITRYNNYYEFSTKKDVIIHLAKELTTEPWTLTLEGEVEKPLVLSIDDILKNYPQEERIYRLRCVEGWSMIIPWNGFSLCKLLQKARPTSKARFVEFVSLMRPEEMIGQRLPTLDWPYREALRIDEAMHPLTMLVTGLYGKPLPKQNGAPFRIAVPWKYAFKSPKAITHIRFTEKRPTPSWVAKVPSEYGFYGNVNPSVAHPRWSQSRENRIGELRKHRTQMFNGYAEQVASLYQGMDLKKHF